MTLPKINAPEYSLVVPSTQVEIKFRPFLVKEEKLLLIAQETGDEKALYTAIKNLIHNCCHGQLDVDTMPLFDVEYVFLQLRGKSVGEFAEVLVICPDDGETEVKVKVNLNELTVELPSKDHNKIQLTDDIGIVLRFPNFQDVATTDEQTSDTLFDMLVETVQYVYDKENVYNDFTKDEMRSWIENLQQQEFEKINNFFNDVPTLKHKLEWTCSACGKDDFIELEGLQSFFT